MLFNSYLKTGVSVLKDFYRYRRLTVYQLDSFRLLSGIVAAPAAYSLTNVNTPAQGQFWSTRTRICFGMTFTLDARTQLAGWFGGGPVDALIRRRS